MDVYGSLGAVEPIVVVTGIQQLSPSKADFRIVVFPEGTYLQRNVRCLRSFAKLIVEICYIHQTNTKRGTG